MSENESHLSRFIGHEFGRVSNYKGKPRWVFSIFNLLALSLSHYFLHKLAAFIFHVNVYVRTHFEQASHYKTLLFIFKPSEKYKVVWTGVLRSCPPSTYFSLHYSWLLHITGILLWLKFGPIYFITHLFYYNLYCFSYLLISFNHWKYNIKFQ